MRALTQEAAYFKIRQHQPRHAARSDESSKLTMFRCICVSARKPKPPIYGVIDSDVGPSRLADTGDLLDRKLRWVGHRPFVPST